ncbi:MAG TPA: GNAT family N-acetyltransferase [Pyrinomonadaceae bacterium]|jgi:diamine N-acetyltransferase
MNVSLREIDKNNFLECINLKVAGGQENFVAGNLMSIAQAKIYPTLEIRGVYAGDEMVGFAMFGFSPVEDKFYLVRLMIDEKHQGKGYGRAAVLAIIERLRRQPECTEIFLSFVPENKNAEKLYTSVGFERTGETDAKSGEIIMRFLLKSNGNGRPATNN